MNEQGCDREGVGKGARYTPWFWGTLFLLGALYIGLQFFPVYHIAHERDPTGGVNDFLMQLKAYQDEHFRRHGRYLGEETWAEWPPGPFPSQEGVVWGTPTEGPWAELPLRPKEPIRFKFRLRASERPELVDEGRFAWEPDGPWFVAEARADLDGDGTLWLIEVNSMVPALYMENEGD